MWLVRVWYNALWVKYLISSKKTFQLNNKEELLSNTNEYLLIMALGEFTIYIDKQITQQYTQIIEEIIYGILFFGTRLFIML